MELFYALKHLRTTFGWFDQICCMTALRKPARTFDDVMIPPRYSEVNTRRIPKLNTHLTRGSEMKIPIIAANMKDVVGPELITVLLELGSTPILHRYFEDNEKLLSLVRKHQGQVFGSVGIKDPKASFDLAVKLVNAGAIGICIDIAHGHNERVVALIRELKKWNPNVQLIAGNICTRVGYRDLVRAGADAVKAGVGPGSPCSTRIQTGCGVPQLQALLDIGPLARREGIPLIADGGIRDGGDVVKALAAGASSVMVGGLLAGADESAAQEVEGSKVYRGQASDEFRQAFYGEIDPDIVAEGVERIVEKAGPADQIIRRLLGGLRSAMTYVGAQDLVEFYHKAWLRPVSSHTVVESHPQPGKFRY